MTGHDVLVILFLIAASMVGVGLFLRLTRDKGKEGPGGERPEGTGAAPPEDEEDALERDIRGMLAELGVEKQLSELLEAIREEAENSVQRVVKDAVQTLNGAVNRARTDGNNISQSLKTAETALEAIQRQQREANEALETMRTVANKAVAIGKLLPLPNGSALRGAAIVGDISKVQQLLDDMVDADSPDEKDGTTPLQLAAGCGQAGVVALLVGAGADLDLTDNCGMTAFMLAARGGHPAILKMLLDAGANVGLKDHENQTAEDHARAGGHGGIAQMLAQAAASGSEEDFNPDVRTGDTAASGGAPTGEDEGLGSGGGE